MEINIEFLEKLEKLSRIKLNDNEKEKAKKDLSDKLEFFGLVKEFTIKDTEETGLSFKAVNGFREDVVEESPERDLILKNAKNKTMKYFKAPRTLD